MNITCPECGVSGTLDDAHAGRKIRCPKCKSLFVAEDSAPAGYAGLAAEAPPRHASSQDTATSSREPSAPEPEETQSHGGAGEAGGDTGLSVEAIQEPPVAAEVPPMPGDDAHGPAEPGHDGAKKPGDTADFRSMRIGDMLSRAWELTAGVKGPIWGGCGVMYGIMMVIVAIVTGLVLTAGLNPDGVVVTLLDLANSALSTVLTAGLMFMGVKRATDRNVVWRDVFAGFPMAGQIIIAMILQGILILIGFVLLVLPGIYLMVGYGMTFALMVDRGMSPWQAMETSRKMIHKVWWKIFGLYLVVMLIIMISAIPLGIGLIWTMPMSIVLYGVVSVALFGD